jgi:transcriptional regulator with XRE-family HTH domain
MGSEAINQQIGQRLRSRRRLLGLTQTQVANNLGVCFQQIHKYEAGNVTISAGMLWRVAQVLEVDVPYFFEGLTSRAGDEPPAQAVPVGPPALL